MIFQSFLLGNLVSLSTKIINSVVVVGLYYGFLTTFSIGPSYLFLLRAEVMEEGTEKKVSATTGFITGQLMMFISIYYAPLHLALGRPHTITVLALPYLLFHFFWNNHKHFLYYGPATRNSMRNFSIQCVFLNNLIFQLFNHFILPSSMLARLVNIYMFRCNNKILFVTSSFVGWLIGHILFMKWLGLVLVWIGQNHSIRSNKNIRSNKYLVSELINSTARIFSILLFTTCVYYLGRIPSPILTKKLKETSKTEEKLKERDLNKIHEREELEVKGKKNEFDPQFTFTEIGSKKGTVSKESFLIDMDEIFDNSRFNKKTKDKGDFPFDKPLVTLLFDSKRWNRPFRYIKNSQFDKAVRNEMSQFFFDICQSDGNERISFTYPTSLSIFLDILKRRITQYRNRIKKSSSNDLYKTWVFTNKRKEKDFNEEFQNRIETLDKESISLNKVETRAQLCNDDSTKEYLCKRYDPVLNGSYRRRIYKSMPCSILKNPLLKNVIEKFWINRIHAILLPDPDYNQKTNEFHKKPFSREIVDFLTFSIQFGNGPGSIKQNGRTPLLFSEVRIDFEKEIKYFQYLLNKIVTDKKEISKKVPRWSYKLISELEQQLGEEQEDIPIDYQIRLRKAKRIVVFTDNTETNTMDTDTTDQTNEIALIRFSQQSDFRRGIIKGSMRAQRRKITIGKLFQENVHSPLFLDRIQKSPVFSFDISGLIKRIFRNWMAKEEAFKNLKYIEEQKKKNEKSEKYTKKKIEIPESWDNIPFAQAIRGCTLVTQSIFRKYILLPSLIIFKNIGRILLLQPPEWSEDFKEWNREMHVKCTYKGVTLSETEFPKNWLIDGIQIRIFFPFYLKPWHKSKQRSFQKDLMKKKKEKDDSYFLTVVGMRAELPFGSTRKQRSFFQPIFKELKKKIRKLKKKSKRKYFQVLTVLKGKTKPFRKVSKETKEWVIKSFLFLKKRIKELSKVNRIFLFQLREVEIYESSEIKEENDSIINNQKIDESLSQIVSSSCKNFILTKKKIKDRANRTSILRDQIERITKEKEKITPKMKNHNLSPNKTSSNAKKFEKWEIVKGRNAQLIYKLPLFVKFFIKQIHIDPFFSIINIIRITTEFFLESKKKIIDKSIYNNERRERRLNKKKKNTIPLFLISTRKKSIDNNNISKRNSHIFYDLSSISQAYVFYRFSQLRVNDSYKLRSVLQYQGISFFLKPEIKKSFETQGLVDFDSKLKDKQLPGYEINQWKNWLRGHYQYDLSQIIWSRLIPKKRRNPVHQHRIAKVNKENESKWHSYEYEKNQLINSKKEKELKVDLLFNQKENFKKYYRYGLLSYKFLNYENKTECFFYESPFQGNKNQEIYYNNNTPKETLFDPPRNIPSNNSLGKGDNLDIDMEKTFDRKYLDWKILSFNLRQKVNTEVWTTIDTNRNQNTQIRTNNSQIVQKKDLFYLMIPERNSPKSSKGFFDWMGMNEKPLKCSISNLELWFFPELVSLYTAYKTKPWFILSNLLFFNFNRNKNKKNSSETNKINEKERRSFLIASNKEHQNQEERKSTSGGDLGSARPQQKDIGENSARSDMKKGKKKKQYKSDTYAELDFFLKRYLLFQLRTDEPFNQRIINNIKISCLLLRLRDPRPITKFAAETGELSFDIMLTQKNLTLPELMKKGVLIIEPIRLSGKKDGQLIMYQTLGISLVHKSKHQRNQKYQEKGYVSKKNMDEAISSYQRITGKRDKNHFDLLVPENILSFRHRRKLRILNFFNSKTRNDVEKNSLFCNQKSVKNISYVSPDHNCLDRGKTELMKFKLFLWANYRLEDLVCMSRYWFDTNNSSHFSMLRIHLYPRLKICG
uniref:Ycf1 protein n=1 Tax=Strobilanthes dalzielii TaxID=3065487 RepID=UPI002A82AEDC|nr:Ycf1 protein [Strobilanthes dalzielii]WOX62036.1 Ycf1 protein [Strobilanthes dalzielii]